MEFVPFPSIPRLFRDITITEKIDGTNACVVIQDLTDDHDEPDYRVFAQSRKRIITPGDDNFGFAAWVHANVGSLVDDLGPGRHFGEWWGSGIQRGYGLPKGERRFSLFNTRKWGDAGFATPGLGVVPVLYEGPFMETEVHVALDRLKLHGSKAVQGFRNPEGICVYHHAGNHVYKYTIEGDDEHKSARAA
jgi:hypothetical protein